jgi:putative glutathione S-transferase
LELRRVELGRGLVIRQAEAEEYGAAEDVLVAAFTTGCWVASDYLTGLRSLARRAWRYHVWVAAPDGQPPLGVVLTPRLEHWDAPHFTFSVLAVAPQGRGLRLGQALVRHALGLARRHGFERVEIRSSPQMSQAHRLYYAEGFVRRIDWETIIVGEHEERLLAFTYREPDPLPPDQVQRVAPAAAPPPDGGAGPWGAGPDPSVFPPPPPGAVDRAGSFVVARPRRDRVGQTAERIWDRLRPREDDWDLVGAGPATAPSAPAEAGEGGAGPDLLWEQIATDLWDGAYAVLHSPSPAARRAAQRVFTARLDTLEATLARGGPYLTGARPSPADALLLSLLWAYDFGFRAGFPPASGAVVNFPQLWHWARRLLAREAVAAVIDWPAPASSSGDGGPADTRPIPVLTGPWGPLPPIAVLPDLRAGWLDPPQPGGPPPRPRPGGAAPTPASGDRPPAAGAAVDLLARLTRARRPRGPEAATVWSRADQPTVAGLNALIQHDLIDQVARVAAGGDAATQTAARRLFFARLSWLEDRLTALAADRPEPGADSLPSHPDRPGPVLGRAGAEPPTELPDGPWLAGPQPSPADATLLMLSLCFDAGQRNVFPATDPAWADYPALTAHARRLAARPGWVSSAELQAIGLIPGPDGRLARPWGEPRPVQGRSDPGGLLDGLTPTAWL